MENALKNIQTAYHVEVVASAKHVLNEYPKQAIEDGDALHEYIDSHQWIIYNRFHGAIIAASQNADYAAEHGLLNPQTEHPDTVCQISFWAFFADVQAELDRLISNSEEVTNA